MDIMALIASFGGGLMGAYMGAVPAFIMTGFLAFVGAIAGTLGLPAGDFIVGQLAFGCFMGPHVAFAGGVAAAAYAGKKGLLKSGGADVSSALNGLNAPDVLLVGGIFGMIGYVLRYIVSIIPFLGANTDQPGIVVFILGVVTRLVFGSTGITGKYTGKGPREWVASGNAMMQNIVLGAGIGIAASFIAASAYTALPDQWGNISANFAVLCFGFAAMTLTFTVMGLAVPGTHHIILPAAAAAVIGVNAFGAGGALFGVVVGIVNSIIGDFAGRTFNSYNDSHIDPPAFTIFTTMIIINVIGSALS